jgi:hypothetical protein
MDDQYENMSLNELKQYCRNNNLKGFSKHKKKESIRDFIRSKNLVEDKDDIIKKLQEELKEKDDRMKELELKEAFEDPEVDNDESSDNEYHDVESEDASSDEFHFDKRYNSEEKMKEEIDKIKKDYEEKLITQKDIMHHKQVKALLRLDSNKWQKILCDRKEETDTVINVIKKGKDVKLINTNVDKYIIERNDHFLNKNGDKGKQVILFHGTEEKNIKSIMENGFCLTMDKAHGAVHGEGIYFTNDIDFAMMYPKDGNPIKNILVCKVYVNNKIIGRTAVNAFPKIPGSNRYYDTGVDNFQKPRQFIKKSVEDINILGHIQIKNTRNKMKSNISTNNNLTGIKIINNTGNTLNIFWNKYTNQKLTNIDINMCKSMGDVSSNDLYHIKSRIGDQFIIGYYDKDKRFNIYRIINVKKMKEVFTID